MKKFSFIARMPNQPGALHKAAEIAKEYNGNIHRIHYNRKIDPNTVFFEISAPKKSYKKIKDKLEEIGYLQTTLKPVNYLKFNIHLPNQTGTLFNFLNYITSSGANIDFLDFDERSSRHDKLTVGVTLDDTLRIETLLDNLKANYRLEIVEYDTKGKKVDDTVFYIDFANKLRKIIGKEEDEFLIHLLNDINHIVQELTRLGEEPKRVIESILLTGSTLKDTKGDNFYVNIQKVKLNSTTELYCFQPPCGGNVFIIKSPQETIMIDTGYGIYQPDFLKLFQSMGIDINKLKAIYLTHADADHCGAAGLYKVKSYMNKGTADIIDEANRAYGSNSEECILEEVYTRLINMFSEFNSPKDIKLFSNDIIKMRGPFPVIHTFNACDLKFEVLESLGGHINGQVFILCEDEGLLFTADSLINFESLSSEQKEYNLLAKDLMTSVNVDGEKAREERNNLLKLVSLLNEGLKEKNRSCLICGGHGAVSILSEDKLMVYGYVNHQK